MPAQTGISEPPFLAPHAAARASVTRTTRGVAEPVELGSPNLPGVSWWMWPHLLSLDAPLVALVWQRWWARTFGIRPTGGEMVILGLGVWMIYLGDRLADTSPHLSVGPEAARHRFYRRQRRLIRPLVAGLFVALTGLTPWLLPVRQFVAGLALLALAGAYFWLIHGRKPRGWSRLLPKEAAVGGMFTAGTAFFVLGRMGSATAGPLAAVVLFGVLCFCNCALITRWENNPTDVREPSSLLNAFPRLTAHLGATCLLLALAACTAAFGLPQGGVLAPIAASALLLAGLHGWRGCFRADALRVLADVALLTPWFGWVLPAHFF